MLYNLYITRDGPRDSKQLSLCHYIMIVIWGIDNDENEENEDDPLARRSEQD